MLTIDERVELSKRPPSYKKIREEVVEIKTAVLEALPFGVKDMSILIALAEIQKDLALIIDAR